MGQSNLVIDLDPQGNATTGFGKSNSDEEKNVYNLLIRKSILDTQYKKLIQKFRYRRITCKFIWFRS